MKYELTTELTLSEEERTLLNMHSVLNVLNTVMFELRNLADDLGDHPALEQAQDVVITVAEDLRTAGRAADHLQAAEELARRITALVDEAVAARPDAAAHPDVADSRANLQSVFRILQVRAQELVGRSSVTDDWAEEDIEELTRKFLEVFSAIEQNSHGGYRIVFNLAAHEDGDYFVDFAITSFRGDRIGMPAVLQDVMRDLIANARKYTAPGGRIIAGLDETPEHLRFVVEDSGRGIPETEVQDVVRFGYRGSNVQDRPTRGGGFGLTKAFYVTRSLGGRMWIESEMDRGTRIELVVPQPAG